MKHEVVAHPERIEAGAISETCALAKEILIGVLPEVWYQQAKPSRHSASYARSA
jgi:hypothetical protein